MKANKDGFINLNLNYDTVDRYIHRLALLSAVSEFSTYLSGNILDVGCGKMPYKEFILSRNLSITSYIGLDLESSNIHNTSLADLHWDGLQMPIESNTFSSVMATEVLEHCPEPSIVISEIYRVLQKSGCFFFTVPFLWPLHEVPYDEYRYTPFSLKRLLENKGFSNITIKPMGGWNASLAQMLGLWLKRSSYPEKRRKYLTSLLIPVIKYLLRTDIKPKSFRESTMITGLYGIAYK
jgi:SAM-dependent methyltransferase